MTPTAAPENQLLRHTLATLAYRAAKAFRDEPPGFSGFRGAEGLRTPGEILAHVCDLLDWALALADGRQEWHNTQPATWSADVERFFVAMNALDTRLSASVPAGTGEALFQGPIADALTHVGQIAMLRRMAGAPVRGENYHRAHIAVGRVGPLQQPAVREFE